MLLLPPATCPAAAWDVDMRQCAVYIGATTDPGPRLRRHSYRSGMAQGVKTAMLNRQQTAQDLFWLPLSTAPAGVPLHNEETLWTLRAQQAGCFMMNCLGVAGTPART